MLLGLAGQADAELQLFSVLLNDSDGLGAQ